MNAHFWKLLNGLAPKAALAVAVAIAALGYSADAADCDGLACVLSPTNTEGQATGGGQIEGELAELAIVRGTAAGGRASFGFNAQFAEGEPGPSGHITFIDHGLRKDVKSSSIDSFTMAGNTAVFTGQATVDGAPNVGFTVEVEDMGEPGSSASPNPDTFAITVNDGYSAAGMLLHGNIQVRAGPPDGELGPLLVGAAKRTLNPTVDVAPPDGQVQLGGYGLGAVRRSQGVLGSGAWVRAFVVDNGRRAIALVESDNQGVFAAYEETRGAVGTIDIAKAVQAQRPALRADHIVIASDHSHAGQDMIGVWGGVPKEYLEFVKNQTVAAVVEAYDRREFAQLSVGAVGGIVAGNESPILNSQFDDSSCAPAPTPQDPGHTALPCGQLEDFPDWDLVDASVRVLHARRADGSTIATFVNFAAHSTVMGSGNKLISPDWPGPTAEKVEAALGGMAVVMPGTNGRTQPDRGSGSDPAKLDAYSTIISNLALDAVTKAVPVVGRKVEAKKRLIFEVVDNAGLLALSLVGGAGCEIDPELCVPIMRARTPPWLTGDVIGTVVSAVRVGNVLFTGTPGEPYPQIAFGIQQAVDAGTEGVGDISHHFLFSLSDDQLGYLIAPVEGIPAAGAKTVDPSDPTDFPANDNFLFNVAATIGDHVMCTAIDLAVDVGLPGDRLHDRRCATWIGEADINPTTALPN